MFFSIFSMVLRELEATLARSERERGLASVCMIWWSELAREERMVIVSGRFLPRL